MFCQALERENSRIATEAGRLIDELKSENERLREALREIEDHHGETECWRRIAWDALKATKSTNT